jgi:predicted lipoprotein with Yx(FWY)xxD motif
VKVSDQPINNGTVTVEQVISPGPGWIVIHINSSGSPGPIIGWAQVKAGTNPNVPVTVDASKATSVLYAMLHVDAGQVGTYEFPGPDVPVNFNGQMVSPAFANTSAGAAAGGTAAGGTSVAPTTAATSAPAATNTTAASGGYGSTATSAPTGGASAAGAATVAVADNAKLGKKILVDSKGITLYIFKKDTPGASNCTGGCVENWPPLLLSSGNLVAGQGVTGSLGQLARTDNGTQVTYNEQPLYYFAGDQAPGDVNGEGIGNAWFAATP